MRDAREDAVERYAGVVERVERVRKEWEPLGCPLTAEGDRQSSPDAPFVVLLHKAERDA